MKTYDHHFLEDPLRDLKVNAAMVGISDRRWEYVPEAEADDDVGIRSRMRAKRFDVKEIGDALYICSFLKRTCDSYSVCQDDHELTRRGLCTTLSPGN